MIINIDWECMHASPWLTPASDAAHEQAKTQSHGAANLLQSFVLWYWRAHVKRSLTRASATEVIVHRQVHVEIAMG